MANIIFLNGSSSAGKTTLAKEIQKLSKERYFHFSIDTFCHMIEPTLFDEDPWSSVNVAANAMHQAIVSVCTDGDNVIIDNVIDNTFIHWLRQCISLFKDFNVTFVNVYCDPEDLAQREIQRGDREIGLAMYQVNNMSMIETYDLHVNTSKLDKTDCARLILNNLITDRSKCAFRILEDKLGANK